VYVFFGAIEDTEEPRHLPDVQYLHIVVLWEGWVGSPVGVKYVAIVLFHFNPRTWYAVFQHHFHLTNGNLRHA
jgi:hypothetical protein